VRAGRLRREVVRRPQGPHAKSAPLRRSSPNQMAKALEAFDFPTHDDLRRLEQLREKELGAGRVRRAAPRSRVREPAARPPDAPLRLPARDGRPPEEARYEHAVQRTLRGVRSRSAFGGGPEAGARRAGDDREETLSMMKDLGQVSLLTAAEEVELARHIQARLHTCAHTLPVSLRPAGPAGTGAHADRAAGGAGKGAKHG